VPGLERASVLVEFSRALRSEGIPVVPTTAADLATACEVVGLASGDDVYHAFRSLVVTRRDQIPVFDRVFRSFFGTGSDGSALVVAAARPRTWSIRASSEGGEADGETGLDDEVAVTGASWAERLAHMDFAELTPAEVAEVRSMIARMLWRPAAATSRRRRPARAGDRPDLRRTLRRSVGPGGDVLSLATTERRARTRPLIFIADVSGSMERYSEMLLYFAHAARSRLGRLESFVFSTRLTRVTRELTRREPSEALREVAGAVHDWSGGTRIGECLRTFNHEWSRRITRGGPIVLVVLDGWDRGEPEVLAAEMGRLRRSVHRVIWLNPLAGRPGYAPETRGMVAALPYVDDFLAAGTFDDLATLVGLLESVPERRR
jgi:uncharacterized protein